MEKRSEFLKDNLRVFVVPVDILKADLDVYEKMVYVVLRSFANPHHDVVWPSNKTIAKLASMTDRGVIKVIKRLEEKGLLKKEMHWDVTSNRTIKQSSNRYTIMNPQQMLSTESSSVGEPHAGGGVNHVQGVGEPRSYKHNNLTKQDITKSINNNIEEYQQEEIEIDNKEVKKNDVVVEEKESVIRSLLALKGITISNHTMIEWRKHASYENIVQAIQEAIEKPGIKNVVGYITRMLEKGYTPSVSTPKADVKTDKMPEYVVNQEKEHSEEDITEEQRLEIQSLLEQVNAL